MKTEVISPASKPQRLPAVGEAYRHNSGGAVYMRIADSAGQRAVGHDSEEAYGNFYCLNLSTGEIIYTTTNRSLYGPLEILQPVGGKIVFEPATS